MDLADGRDSTTTTPLPNKKAKLLADEAAYIELQQYHNQLLLAQLHQHQQHQQMHHYPALAFPAWPPPPPTSNSKFLAQPPPSSYTAAAALVNGLSYLNQHQEPPLLQNPERVIRMSEYERFERTYQPNVALAPRQRLKEAAAAAAAASGLVKVKQEPMDTIPMTCHLGQSQSRSSPAVITTIVSGHGAVTITKATTAAVTSPEQFSNEITSSTSPTATGAAAATALAYLHQPSVPLMLKDTKAITIQPIIKPEFDPAIATTNECMNVQMAMPALAADDTKRNGGCNSTSNTIISKNIGGGGVFGNPEFELSTDTDDESVTGEADSSNGLTATMLMAAPLDAVHHLLVKEPKQAGATEKVMHIVKVLLHENWQVRQENSRLEEDLRRKESHIAELQALLKPAAASTAGRYNHSQYNQRSQSDEGHQQQQQEHQQHADLTRSHATVDLLTVCKPEEINDRGSAHYEAELNRHHKTMVALPQSSATSSSSASSLGSRATVSGSTVSSPPLPCVKLKQKAIYEMNHCSNVKGGGDDDDAACNNSANNLNSNNNDNNNSSNNNNNNSTTITAIKLPPKKQHEIMKPLKKSLRRSPDEMRAADPLAQSSVVVAAATAIEQQQPKEEPPASRDEKTSITIQSKKHRIFLNKQKLEEEQQQKRLRNCGGGAESVKADKERDGDAVGPTNDPVEGVTISSTSPSKSLVVDPLTISGGLVMAADLKRETPIVGDGGVVLERIEKTAASAAQATVQGSSNGSSHKTKDESPKATTSPTSSPTKGGLSRHELQCPG